MSLFKEKPGEPADREEALAIEPARGSATKTVEAWCELKKTPDWLFGAARRVGRWGEGRELTEVEYVATLEKASGARMMSGDLVERK